MTSKSKSRTENQYDDLTTIKGIKAARQQWFREMFSVRTFSDLAALSIDEIETRLKAEKQIPSRSKIEGWLTEARHFAENPALIANLKSSDSHKEEGWKPFASFVVEFQEREIEGQLTQQTLVHHVEAHKTRIWPHIEQQKLCDWIVGQLGSHIALSVPQAEMKAEQLVLEVPLSLTPPPPAQETASNFSPRLQQLLQKSQRPSGQPPQPNIQPISPALKSSMPAQSASNVGSQTGFSEGLQRALAKAQRLSGKK